MSSRSTLKNYFKKGDVPTENNFSDLIDSAFIQSEDGIRKQGSAPVALEAQADSNGEQPVLHFYKHFSDKYAAWKLSLLNPTPVSSASGLSIGSATTPNSLFIQESDGNVGIGMNNPNRPLTIQGKGYSNELLSLADNSGATRWHFNMPEDTHDLNIVESGVADNRLYLQAGGNIGIGTGSPAAKLHVSGGNAVIDGNVGIGTQYTLAFH